MAKQGISLRVDEELLAWADEYAAKRNVSRTELLAGALVNFREDCERGVPEFRQQAAAIAARGAALVALQGVGDCPERPGELGHIWKSVHEDEFRSCKFCGMKGRAPHDPSKPAEEQEGFFAQATRERAEFFDKLGQPQSVRGTTAKEAKR